MAIFPDRYETTHHFATKTPDGRDMVFYSGYAIFDEGIKGTGSDWHRVDVILVPEGPEWVIPEEIEDVPGILEGVVATVVPASIYNRNVANNAGWAVDNCFASLESDSGLMALHSRVAVRDSDGYMLRLAYQATAIGTIANRVRAIDPGVDPRDFDFNK